MVHGGAGVAQEVRGQRVAVRGEGDADADRHEVFAPVEAEWCADHIPDTFGDGPGFRVVGDLVAQDDELVSPEPGHGIAGPHCG